MITPTPSDRSHGLPRDPKERKKVRDGLSDDEKKQWDEIVQRIDAGKKPNKEQSKTIRKWKQQRKIAVPSKAFRSPSDK
ncbi:MAG: hypothetical protein L0Y72_31690 [Gemmataceae bacterium]|nr:hypothetical protein [Gemmataceae bacterium]MCI0743616.1 hypothetical protein [Gemmataceae bacterium]